MNELTLLLLIISIIINVVLYRKIGHSRRDAITRSSAVIRGQVTEHLIPYFPNFPFNPKEARFIGSPVDYLIFDGVDEEEMRKIVFLEIKTNGSRLNARQRRIKEAVDKGRIEWRELRI